MITVVQHSLHNSQAVLIASIPQLIGAVVMIAWARLARRRSPVVTTIIPTVAAAAAMAIAAYASGAVIFVSAVCVALAGSYSAVPQFWRLPPLRLRGLGAAAGIALISSAGYVSLFVAPYITGYTEDVTGNFRMALLLITVITLLGVPAIAFAGRPAPRGPAARAEAGTTLTGHAVVLGDHTRHGIGGS
jgi:MFS transporter, ACS family, tartrate transporter